jgi:Zn-dependent M28 family amino/carboxypeptidase
MTVVGRGSSDLEDLLAVAAAAEGRVLQPDPSPEFGAFFRSDHYPFAKKGVPALFAVGGPEDAKPDSVVMQRFEEYVTKHYHRPSDEWSADWDLTGVVQDARIYYRVGRVLANDDRMPNWRWDHEFRTLRDRTRAARP